MSVAFTITPVEKGVMRCRHTAPFQSSDVQSLANFLNNYRGKLLVDLTGASGEECARHLKQFRPMMPITAIFGADIDPSILEISESYYAHAVRYFKTEAEALNWIHNQ
jgi:hypothetical protein